MPEETLSVIAFLILGYVLFVVEIVVPGGILGILGTLSVVYGCYLAFDLGTGWGVGSIVASLLVFAGSIRFFLRSKTGQALTLEDNSEPATWKSAAEDWAGLVGEEGTAVSDLRPAGIGAFGDRRLDIVTDGEFLGAGAAIRVVEVEGRRIMVEPTDGWGGDDAETPSGNEATDGASSDTEDEPANEARAGEEGAGKEKVAGDGAVASDPEGGAAPEPESTAESDSDRAG